MTLAIYIMIFLLNFIYCLMKGCKIQNKVVFISRESNSPSIDIQRLEESIGKKNPKCKVVVLCKTLEVGVFEKISYGFHMLRQMYHMATAKIVVLDTYCILASVLKHKKDLKIVQMWHAVGCLKKFGWSILDREEGRDSKIAKLLRMHQNYDYVFVSNEVCKADLSEAYKCSKDIMKIFPLPRLDILRNEKELNKISAAIRERYHFSEGKETILYAPTFRKCENGQEAVETLIKNIDLQKYNFVIKYHPIAGKVFEPQGVIVDELYSTLEWLGVADYVVTDYSAVVYEAAVARKPIFFYAYDWESYKKGRDFYIDFRKEMPGLVSKDVKKIVEAIENKKYDMQKVENFANKYIANADSYTENITDFLLELL